MADRIACFGRVGPGTRRLNGHIGLGAAHGTARAVATHPETLRRTRFLHEVVRDPGLSAQVLNGLSLRSGRRSSSCAGPRARTTGIGSQRAVEALRFAPETSAAARPLRAAIVRSGFARCEFESGSTLFEEGATSDGVFWIESAESSFGPDARAPSAAPGALAPANFSARWGCSIAAALRHRRRDNAVTASRMSPEEFAALLRRSPGGCLR